MASEPNEDLDNVNVSATEGTLMKLEESDVVGAGMINQSYDFTSAE